MWMKKHRRAHGLDALRNYEAHIFLPGSRCDIAPDKVWTKVYLEQMIAGSHYDSRCAVGRDKIPGISLKIVSLSKCSNLEDVTPSWPLPCTSYL
jgi:hypothetical protein